MSRFYEVRVVEPNDGLWQAKLTFNTDLVISLILISDITISELNVKLAHHSGLYAAVLSSTDVR